VDESAVRTSDQDFATTVAPAAPATTAAAPAPKGKLSNFEKVLLVGLGAVAVGAILSNGDRVVSNSGDRVVVERDGELRVLKDDDARLRQPGSEVRTETFNDGSTRTTVQRSDGSEVVTIRGADGSVLLRERVMPDGTHYTLFDDTSEAKPVNVKKLPKPVKMAAIDQGSNEALRQALGAELQDDIGRNFSLRQVRYLPEVRQLAPEIALESIRFPSGSAAIPPEQARELARVGLAVADLIDAAPGSVILIEGHTDAVGDAGYNLALSDRRAETVALALSEYFEVPPENIVTQGYGETELKVPTLADEPANRRAVLRNITGLLR
jgi:outer membrane protein OmpA-like peptidoglycan-associated protein